MHVLRVLRPIAVAAVVGAAGLAAGCGGGDSGGSGGSAAKATAKPYVIEVSGHMTGAGSDFYAPRVEGLRVFFDDLNSRGGINGHKVELTIKDNRGDATVATSQAQDTADGDALLGVLSSSSATIQPYAAVANRSKVPSIYLGPCYPPAASPGNSPNWFCVGPNPVTDSYQLLDVYMQLAHKAGLAPPAPAYVSSSAPGNLAVFKDFIVKVAEKDGVKPGGFLTSLPFDQTDFTSTANKIISSGANSVMAYSIPSQQNGVAQALVSRGFKGPYVMVGNAPGTSSAMRDMKAPNVYSLEWTSPANQGTPLHKVIDKAAKAQHANAPTDDLVNGWVLGMMLQKAISQCGANCTRDTLLKTIDGGVTIAGTPGLEQLWGPVPPKWDAQTHTVESKGYLLVHYDPATKDLAPVGDWMVAKERPFEFPK